MRKDKTLSALCDLLDLLKRAKNVDPEISSAVAQFACVSANGHIEEYFKYSMEDYYRKRCDENALRIVRKTIRKYYNFKSDRVFQFFSDMRPERQGQVEKCFSDRAKLADALGSIVGNKNTVGHSGGSTVTPARVMPWIEEVIEALEEIENNAFQ